MVGDVRSELGPVDILVNAAGIANPEGAIPVSEDAWDQALNTNLKGRSSAQAD